LQTTPHLPHAPLCASLVFQRFVALRDLYSFPTRRSSDLLVEVLVSTATCAWTVAAARSMTNSSRHAARKAHDGLERTLRNDFMRSEEHTSELQSPDHLVCRLLLEKKKKKNKRYQHLIRAD